jgi:hypothetical protein
MPETVNVWPGGTLGSKEQVVVDVSVTAVAVVSVTELVFVVVEVNDDVRLYPIAMLSLNCSLAPGTPVAKLEPNVNVLV